MRAAPWGDAPPYAAPFLIVCPDCHTAIGWKCPGESGGMHTARVRAALAQRGHQPAKEESAPTLFAVEA